MIEEEMQFAPFEITCKIPSWFPDSQTKPLTVKTFKYTLSQFSPSVYATILIYIPETKLPVFKNIEMLPTLDRKVEINFSKLYDTQNKINYFTGPYKFIVNSYSIDDTSLLLDPQENGNTGYQRVITLNCIDEVFYRMSLDQKTDSYGSSKISDVVNSLILRNHGIAKEVVGTNDEGVTWIQTYLSDYEMIRSMIPYAKSNDGVGLYTFFMLNGEGYFAPITYGKVNTVKLSIANTKNLSVSANNEHYQTLLDRYGAKDKLKVISAGYENDKVVKPTAMVHQNYSDKTNSNKQGTGVADRTLSIAIDNEKIKQNYADNIYNRIHTFRKLVSLSTIAIPDLTPINAIELLNRELAEGMEEYVGVYTIISVEYTYNSVSSNMFNCFMNLVLGTEVETKGQESTEGQARVTNAEARMSNPAATKQEAVKQKDKTKTKPKDNTKKKDPYIEKYAKAAGISYEKAEKVVGESNKKEQEKGYENNKEKLAKKNKEIEAQKTQLEKEKEAKKWYADEEKKRQKQYENMNVTQKAVVVRYAYNNKKIIGDKVAGGNIRFKDPNTGKYWIETPDGKIK